VKREGVKREGVKREGMKMEGCVISENMGIIIGYLDFMLLKCIKMLISKII
jgi:hypothetical protein